MHGRMDKREREGERTVCLRGGSEDNAHFRPTNPHEPCLEVVIGGHNDLIGVVSIYLTVEMWTFAEGRLVSLNRRSPPLKNREVLLRVGGSFPI